MNIVVYENQKLLELTNSFLILCCKNKKNKIKLLSVPVYFLKTVVEKRPHVAALQKELLPVDYLQSDHCNRSCNGLHSDHSQADDPAHADRCLPELKTEEVFFS